MGNNRKYSNGLVCGVGISDKGKYPAYVNGKDTREYSMWQKMLARCYYDKSLLQQPTYEQCEVSEEFLSFQNFAQFYHDNKWTNELKLIADKDILTHNASKIYSRETILFVDKNINTLFTRRQRFRGDYPIGITKYHNKYKVMCNKNNKPVYLGLYTSINEAFSVYKKFKEDVIKETAQYYKDTYGLPDKIYTAMLNYEVNIND